MPVSHIWKYGLSIQWQGFKEASVNQRQVWSSSPKDKASLWPTYPPRGRNVAVCAECTALKGFWGLAGGRGWVGWRMDHLHSLQLFQTSGHRVVDIDRWWQGWLRLGVGLVKRAPGLELFFGLIAWSVNHRQLQVKWLLFSKVLKSCTNTETVHSPTVLCVCHILLELHRIV